MLTDLLRDLGYGARMLVAKPGFTLAAVLTLALGIGANTAVFSVVDTLLLKPLPYADSERLVEIHNTYPHNDLLVASNSIPDYLDRRGQAPALADVALYTRGSYNLNAQGAPQRTIVVVGTGKKVHHQLCASADGGRVAHLGDV